MPDDMTVDADKFNRLLGKMIQTDPLRYKDLTSKPKFRKDGGENKAGRKPKAKNAKDNKP